MNREYDIFEKFQDESVVWRECITGKEKALLRLSEFGRQSENEFFAIHTPTGEVVGRVNLAEAGKEEGLSKGQSS